MARRKTLPESLSAKLALAGRLSNLRMELFGDRGGPEMARRLGIPVRTWYNYEGGVTVPAEVVLRIIELTSVEPTWLLHGTGSKFRQESRAERSDAASQPGMTVGALLRTALRLLENDTGDLGRSQCSALEPRRGLRRSDGYPPQAGMARGSAGESLYPRERAVHGARLSSTVPVSPIPSTMTTPVNSTARWWSCGSTTSRQSAGSGIVGGTLSCVPRILKKSPNSNSSTSIRARKSTG